MTAERFARRRSHHPLVALLLAALLLAPALSLAAQEEEPVLFGFEDVNFRDVITSTVKLLACDDLKPALGAVDLNTFQTTMRRCSAAWSGSGTVIRPDGVILTNAHVALDTRQREAVWLLVMRTIDDRSLPEPAFFARAVLSSPINDLDLAVIVPAFGLDGTPIGPGDVAMRPLPMVEAGEVSIGDDLRNIGYPGVGGELITITQGSVSGFDPDSGVPEMGNVGWIKTDATLGGGISGGTTIDDDGRFIGVPTQLREIETRSIGQVAQINLVRPIPEGFDTLQRIGTGDGIPPLGEAAEAGAAAEVALRGSVVSADSGEPVSGAWFIVLKPGVPVTDYLDGRQDAVHAFATTGADGAFQIREPIARGQAYGVVVVARGYRNTSEDNRVLAPDDAPAVLTLPPIELAVQR